MKHNGNHVYMVMCMPMCAIMCMHMHNPSLPVTCTHVCTMQDAHMHTPSYTYSTLCPNPTCPAVNVHADVHAQAPAHLSLSSHCIRMHHSVSHPPPPISLSMPACTLNMCARIIPLPLSPHTSTLAPLSCWYACAHMPHPLTPHNHNPHPPHKNTKKNKI